MNLKINLTPKRIFNVIYTLIVLFNLITFVLLFNFARKYVYGSIVVDPNFLQSQTTKLGSDLDLDKFNLMIQTIEEKQQQKNTENIKNVF